MRGFGMGVGQGSLVRDGNVDWWAPVNAEIMQAMQISIALPKHKNKNAVSVSADI